jgi:hypothetical protein
MELEKSINIQADIEILDSKLKEFMEDNFKKGSEKIAYSIAYNLEKERYEIKSKIEGKFIEDIPNPAGREINLKLINDFSCQNKVSLDYLVKSDLLLNMNHQE